MTHDVTKWTKAKFLNAVGKKTEAFLRFSTVALELGSADTVRDPRGFALKLYTEDGNYDLVGTNTPIFFIRDPLKFPDFIHSQKRDPYTHGQEPDNAWDFFSHSPEATHQFTWLFGDRGIPATYRHMDGFGSHTYQWMNAKGEAFWVPKVDPPPPRLLPPPPPKVDEPWPKVDPVWPKLVLRLLLMLVRLVLLLVPVPLPK